MSSSNSFTSQGIPIVLNPSTPSVVDSRELSKELHNIGLTCELAAPEQLEQYIQETVADFPKGLVESFGYSTFANMLQARDYGQIDMGLVRTDKLYQNLSDISGNWAPSDSALGYNTQLQTVVFPEHFDRLYDTGQFIGVKQSEQYDGFESTVSAIKQQFSLLARNISSVVVSNLDADAMQAAFVNIISPVDESMVDYDPGVQNRTLFLVEGYHPATSGQPACADAIGALNVEWHLKIERYKEKKKKECKHYILSITVRAVLYDNEKSLQADCNRVLATLKNKLFFRDVAAIPLSTGVEIFDSLPPANADTFNRGLPLAQTENDYMDVVVLNRADLQDIGVIDNTQSDAECTYEKSVTRGFTFSSTQTIAAGLEYEAGALLVKSKLSVSLELSFDESWDKTETETVSFTVPAGKRAYLYQGYTNANILRMDCRNCTFRYVDTGRALTPIVLTSKEPLTDDVQVKNLRSESCVANGPELLWMCMSRQINGTDA